jgi:hypothetical protein
MSPFGSSSSTSPGGSAQSYNQGLFGGTGWNVVGPSTANPFQPYYANPFAIGVPSTSTTTGGTGSKTGSGSSTGAGISGGTTNQKPSFGVVLYPNTSTTTGTTGTTGFGGTKTGTTGVGTTGFGTSSSTFGANTKLGSSGTTGMSGFGSGTTGSTLGGSKGLGTTGAVGSGFGAALGANSFGGAGAGANVLPGFSTMGMSKNGPYVTGLGPTVPPVVIPPASAPLAPGSIQFKANQVIQLSSKLPSKGNIQIGTQGQTVILNGTVADAHEKSLAENMIRLTPGVKSVVNNLQVQGGQ